MVGRGDAVERLAVDLGIGPEPLPFIARGLHLARSPDPGADFGRAFRRRRQDQVGGGDGGHLAVKIDAIEKRSRHLGLIIGGAARCPGASERGIAEMAASAEPRGSYKEADSQGLR